MAITHLALAVAAELAGWNQPLVEVPPVPPTQTVLRSAASNTLIVASPSGEIVTVEDLTKAISGAGLVAVGEGHDCAAHHIIQAEVLALLADRVPKTAVGFEMVSYEDQAVLDSFSAGTMPESQFIAWWKKNWGYDYALYKPIFDEARKRGIPMYGLNAPAALVKEVGKKGLTGLSPADRARLPAVVEESADARYRDFVLASVTGHDPARPSALKNLMTSLGAPPRLDPAAIARMLQVMAVWNETMGEQAARRVAEGRTILLVAGQGHVLYKAGVPESAARRGVSTNVVIGPYPFGNENLSVPEMLARLRDPSLGELEQADFFRLIVQ